MIQSVLFFLFGFLAAGFLVLLVAPAVLRRAGELTRKRMEASLPLSMNELQAEKDRARAESAVAIRRLEVGTKKLKDDMAQLKVDVSRKSQELQVLSDERDGRDETIAVLEEANEALGDELTLRDKRNAELAGELEQACNEIEANMSEIDRLGRLYDEAALVSSNRQIDLVERETEIEKLYSDIEAVKAQRREVESEFREVSAQYKAVKSDLQARDKRVTTLERKIEEMMTRLSDQEETLDRREKELKRLRADIKESAGSDETLTKMLRQAEEQVSLLEARLAEQKSERQIPQREGTEFQLLVGELDRDRRRLEERLKKIMAENRRLKAANAGSPANGDARQREDAALRSQINELAAEIVHLTGLLEGPDSSIEKIISSARSRAGSAEKATSIADRVRALREAAAAV